MGDSRAGLVRRHDVERATGRVAEHQAARKWRVVGVGLDLVAMVEDVLDLIHQDAALKHTPRGRAVLIPRAEGYRARAARGLRNLRPEQFGVIFGPRGP